MTTLQPWRVVPGPPLAGRMSAPGDKSITHRAILLGLMASGTTLIEGANPGADCAASLHCAERLGAGVERGTALRITGTSGKLEDPAGPLDCGNSGTTLRLLAGILAGAPFRATLTGDESLLRRPVARVIEPLRLMGARLSAREEDRLPPLVIEGGVLHGIAYRVPMASAQVATCVLLAGLHARGRTSVELPGPARDHTEHLLPAFGVPLRVEPLAAGGSRVSLDGPAVPRGITLMVPGDFSAAAFFLAAAAAVPGASVTVEGVSLNATRTGLLDVLERMGAHVERRAWEAAGGEPVGVVEVRGPERLVGCEIPPEWLPRMIDEVPAWTVAAAAAEGTSRLTGADELRVKESDRLAALAKNLVRLGVAVEEAPGGLTIRGSRIGGGEVEAFGDHRIAMAMAVLGTRASGPVRIDDAGSVATSYPGFVDTLRALGGMVETGNGP